MFSYIFINRTIDQNNSEDFSTYAIRAPHIGKAIQRFLEADPECHFLDENTEIVILPENVGDPVEFLSGFGNKGLISLTG